MSNISRTLEIDPWKIIEQGFDPAMAEASESLFSIGNGSMGSRANFEESYSGTTLQGNYIGGIYYPDKTRVGWWKNGYPDYFAKVLNSAFWIGVNLTLNGQNLDLAKCCIVDFRRELDMKQGLLSRTFTVRMDDSTELRVVARRFFSMADFELGAISYSLSVLRGNPECNIELFIEADVRNQDANYDEQFWEKIHIDDNAVVMRTKKSGYEVAWAQSCSVTITGETGETATPSEDTTASENEAIFSNKTRSGHDNQRVSARYNDIQLHEKDTLTICKYVGVTSSLNHNSSDLLHAAMTVALRSALSGFDALLTDHATEWTHKWESCDIQIDGDEKAQQGIRFCIFQLLQTYTGRDDRLNIGPKGFTGEKYGGSTYWDTEAYCLPFYLATSGEDVARQLLIYRYKQLDKAIDNARKLGFGGGAALYPMVTMTGEECHNEWEITFEEIHRNGAIAYAIYNFCRYTATQDYLASHGLEILVAIARFWAQRATYSYEKHKFVILGVTGPNEYENNVNNNWYTNLLARWCLRYAVRAAKLVSDNYHTDYQRIVAKSKLNEASEFEQWNNVADNMYMPENKELNIFMQQDGYMDKEQMMAADLDPSVRPINQHWSWDRILRSCFIKQADVLQGLYFFREDFDIETVKRNFYFYEPRTVHESSLSSCVHAILAADIGNSRLAYDLYLRASRLDLDDYNREVHEGLHITSMAGSWLSLVEGFGGLRVGRNGRLNIDPRMPYGWISMRFKVRYRGVILSIAISSSDVTVRAEPLSEGRTEAEISILGSDYTVGNKDVIVKLNNN